MSELLSVKDVVKLLKVSPSTLYQLRKKEDFPAAKQIGQRRLLFAADEIAAWLASR